jgi:hypothetical protein
MSIFKTQAVAINRFLNGWGFVEGRFVYVPLWDPGPEEEKFAGYRALFTANALIGLSKIVTSPEIAKKLNGLAKELAGSVSGSVIEDWDDGDICPPNWPPRHHFGGGGGDPEPDPIYFEDRMPGSLKNDIAGYLIQRLGEMTGNRDIVNLGSEALGQSNVLRQ